jgi:hypothetical protein
LTAGKHAASSRFVSDANLLTICHSRIHRNILPSSLDQASITSRSNGGPTYDNAYLSELKASTPTSRPPLSNNLSYDADISMNFSDVSIQSIQSVDVFG